VLCGGMMEVRGRTMLGTGGPASFPDEDSRSGSRPSPPLVPVYRGFRILPLVRV
jgi:hypothetical protein